MRNVQLPLIFVLCLVFMLCAGPARAATAGLPLDTVTDFAEFFKQYKELSKKEQLRYLALPFTVARLEDGTKDPEITKYTTAQEVEKFTRTWPHLVPGEKRLGGWVLVRTGKGQRGEETICLAPHPNSGCGGVYTFKKIHNAWRMIQYYINDAGI